MTALWTSDDLRRALSVPVRSSDIAASGVSIDTRSMQPGDLFIALPGNNTNGDAFTETALQKGASAIISSKSHSDSRVITVEDTVRALERLACYARQRFRGTVFGLTGSVGKTTLKEMLLAVLKTGHETHATAGNYNNHLGVPLTLARMPSYAEFAIIEMGMNHSGEIAALTELAKPDHVAITTIAAAHLEHFSGLHAIAGAKAEIFRSTPPPKTAVLPTENAFYAFLVKMAQAAGVKTLIGAGSKAEATVRLQMTEEQGNGTLLATIVAPKETVEITFHHPHRPVLHAALMTMGLLAAAGVPTTPAMLSVLGAYKPAAGRGGSLSVPWQGGTLTLVDDSYNASPVAVAAALASLGNAAGRRVAILGDMLELGSGSAALHRDLVPLLRQHTVVLVGLCGEQMTALADLLVDAGIACHAADDADTLAQRMVPLLQPGDTVLVKGSAGMGMRRLVDAIAGKG